MYYSKEELNNLGLKSFGNNVKISKLAKLINPKNISIKNNVRIDDYCFLSASSGVIEINNYVHLSRNCNLISGTKIIINDFCGISNNCSLFGKSDIYDGSCLTNPTVPDKFSNLIIGDIILEKHSIIGSTSVVLPNTILSEGTAIGTLSKVQGKLDEWTIYAGSPLIKIRKRQKKCLEYEKLL